MLKLLVATTVSGAISYHGLRKKSLSFSGAVAGFMVGFFSILAGLEFTLALLAFYGSSSVLTKLGSDIKKAYDGTYKEVLSNGGPGLVICLFLVFNPNMKESVVYCCRLCYLCHYCVCNGDTWASEIGTAYGGQPVLISSLRPVPPGTNGGVSLCGLAASFVGGSFIALCVYLSSTYVTGDSLFANIFLAAGVGGLFGFCGSLVDSLMGATLQSSYYSLKERKIVKQALSDSSVKIISGYNVLSNSQINFLSSLILCAIVVCVMTNLWIDQSLFFRLSFHF